MTYEDALFFLRVARPFEGSVFERSATAVYEHGLFANGVPTYATLDDALSDWRAEYERELAEDAQLIASGQLPANPWHIVAWHGAGERVAVAVDAETGATFRVQQDQAVHDLGVQLEESLTVR